MKRSGLPTDDPLRGFDGRATEFKFSGDRLADVLGDVIERWPSHRSSDHLRLEIAAAFDVDRKCTLPSVDAMLAQGVADIDPRSRRWYLDRFAEPSALADSDPVPGCGCPACTGIPADHPVRQRQIRRRQAGYERFTETVEKARAVSLLEVVQRLALGTPAKKGKELAVRCPFHEDNDPSLRLNPTKQLWYCAPCALGGDGIKLYMQARCLSFTEAVRELAA